MKRHERSRLEALRVRPGLTDATWRFLDALPRDVLVHTAELRAIAERLGLGAEDVDAAREQLGCVRFGPLRIRSGGAAELLAQRDARGVSRAS